ncbi:hypothetical protein RhiirA1_407815 [Rhizophagus irregularis]|uniref:Transmembrane protein 53 n=2 Tax=Rhizophagus irregularis TaxID=588596 RepID=A0A2N0SIG9_9GLOM|nr:hypothetical protein RhiirA1_407815 [Rhizophagus irregularis]
MEPKIFILLVTSITLFNTKTLSHKYFSSPKRHFISSTIKYKFFNFNNNFYFKRQLKTTISNAENANKTFVYQPSQQSPSSSDTATQHQTSHESHHHIHNISEVYPAYDDDSFTQKSSSHDKPSLMILIGWWNCKPKYLHKYISLYTNTFHTNTLSHIPPFYHVFFPWTIPRDINRLAKELISMWIEQGKPKNIGFHVFSNNGTYHYAMLCEAVKSLSKNYLENDQKQISSGTNISSEDAESFLNSIKSCVIDSAPSPITEKYLALGIMGSFLRRTLLNPSIPSSNSQNEVSMVKLPFLVPVLSIFFTLPIVKKYQDFAHKSLYNIPGGIHDGRDIKYLFLYGPGDKIVPEKDTIEFISKIKERESNFINIEGKKGILKIVEKRFGADSEHVQHFLRYPDEYIIILKSFYNIE